jgi:polyphosphate kinase
MELSNLAFQDRVAYMAGDRAVPLLERVRFLAILGSNLDEFFMTRVAGFKRQIALGNTKKTLDGISPEEQMELIGRESRALLNRIYGDIIPGVLDELKAEGIGLLNWGELEEQERGYLRANYMAQLDAVIIPLLIPADNPFPHVRNLRLALHITLEGDSGRTAIVELPDDLPRLVPLPGGRRFIPLEEVIRESLPRLLDGERIHSAFAFRVTRSGNLSIDAESTDDIVEAVSQNIARRPFQPVVRIEIESTMPAEMAVDLVARLAREAETRLSNLGPGDVSKVGGLIDLNRLQQIAALPIPESS